MQAGTLLALLLAMIVVNVVLLTFVVIQRRSRAAAQDARLLPPIERIDQENPRHPSIGPPHDPDEPAVDGVPTATYDRVVRIVSLVFILSTSTIVVVTGLWPDTERHPRPPRHRRALRPGHPRRPADTTARSGPLHRRGLGRDHVRRHPRRPDRP